MSSQTNSLASSSSGAPTAAWDIRRASHLLRRTVMGPRLDEIRRAADRGMNATIDSLLADISTPSPPVKYRDDDDPYLKTGQTWVNTPYKGKNAYRGISIKAWYMNEMVTSHDRTNLRDRMVFFWCDYFGIEGERSDHRAMYQQLRLYQEKGLGNLREMLERVTVMPRMLQFLDGAVNNASNPNENYGRELMELFTIGKGDIAGPGDYTTYTEQDVKALARSLTGWRNRDYLYSDDNVPVESYFDSSKHDTGTKQLSHRFGNQTIRNAGANEYKEVIKILLSRKDTALNFSRKLYRYFVYYDISQEVEAHLIHPMAETMMDNNYEIKPALRLLFRSKYFYRGSNVGAMIKNPQEYICSILRPFREFEHNDDANKLRMRYEIGNRYSDMIDQLDLEVLEAPTVAGWRAYYEAPQYYRYWISPSMLQYRYRLANNFINREFRQDGKVLDIDWLGYIKSLPNKYDINRTIDDIALTFLPRELSSEQKKNLKFAMMDGESDQHWEEAVRNYIAHSDVYEYWRPMEKRLRRFFTSLLSLAEFQLQ